MLAATTIVFATEFSEHIHSLSLPGAVNATACAAPPPSASAQASAPSASQRRDTIATIAGADRASGRAVDSTGGAEGDDSFPMEETESADFANYFYSYAELDHQKQMLEDER